MFKTIRHLAASAAVLSALFVAPVALAQAPSIPAVVPAARDAGPAMWVISDADSTIYLYGSIHLLKPQTPWGQAHVDAAFNSADEVWFELTDMDDQAQMMGLLQSLGFSPDRPLSSLMTPDDIAKLDVAARSIGANAAALDPMRPWLVAMQLAVVQMAAGGFDPNLGVDKIMTERAKAQGKTLRGFESMAEQFGILAGLSDEGQVQMLRSTLKDLDKGPEQLNTLVAAWATGDVDKIDNLMVEEMKLSQPEAYDAMLTRRNANWVRQIKSILDGSGTSFVVVGAAHLAGDESVQSMLAAQGIHVERVYH